MCQFSKNWFNKLNQKVCIFIVSTIKESSLQVFKNIWGLFFSWLIATLSEYDTGNQLPWWLGAWNTGNAVQIFLLMAWDLEVQKVAAEVINRFDVLFSPFIFPPLKKLGGRRQEGGEEGRRKNRHLFHC